MAKKSVKESDTKKNIKESNTKKTLKSKKKVEEKTEVDSPVVKKGKHGPYFGYGFRLGLFFVLFLLFFGAGVFALVSSIVIFMFLAFALSIMNEKCIEYGNSYENI